MLSTVLFVMCFLNPKKSHRAVDRVCVLRGEIVGRLGLPKIAPTQSRDRFAKSSKNVWKHGFNAGERLYRHRSLRSNARWNALIGLHTKKTVSMGRNSIGYVARPTEISSLHLHMVNFISFHFKEFSIPTQPLPDGCDFGDHDCDEIGDEP